MEEENGAKNINPKVDNKWNNYKTFVIDLRLFLWSMLYIRNRMTLVTSGPMDPWVVDCSKKFWGWSSLDWSLVTGLEMHWWTPFYISILGMSALVYWTWDKILLTIIGRCHPQRNALNDIATLLPYSPNPCGVSQSHEIKNWKVSLSLFIEVYL